MNTDITTDIVDCPDYYTSACQHFEDLIEKPIHWDNWVGSDRRYMLVSLLMIIENDIEVRTGTVTSRFDCRISSDNIEDLYQVWKSAFFQQRFDSTTTHFIVDTKKRKVVKFLSVCA